MEHLTASSNAVSDIEKISYPGQPQSRRNYKSGYEDYFNQMPIIYPEDLFLHEKMLLSRSIMQRLGSVLSRSSWIAEHPMSKGEFERTIIAMEPPSVGREGGLVEGAEFVIAKWGHGFTSPIHGHAVGYMHEEILLGEIMVNSYRLTEDDTVRLVRSDIAGRGTVVSQYAPPSPDHKFKRQTLIHNFRSIGYSASLHYLPEHTRDGRDNRFDVEYFDDAYPLTSDQVTRLTAQQAMYLRPGEVVLVRSDNVPEFGDHYIIITGPVVKKKHGIRPQEIAIEAPGNNLLDLHEKERGLILLHLNEDAKEAFHVFHDIHVIGNQVIFPDI